MKGRTKTYILLVSVLIIWGVIGFKVLSTLRPEKMVDFKPELTSKFELMDTRIPDSFSIYIPTRDPFLGTVYSKKTAEKSNQNKPKDDFKWVLIQYHGMITKHDDNKKICVLSINEAQQVMRVGQTFKEVKLIRAKPDKVVVRYKGRTKTIIKS
ncbi:hypothetical protein [Aestuariibaculum sediminum]|uniref:Type II secretion system protein GspC N-terminal domain-containing protein n=1 Tax=Aestuariibaculum sediminum TaxID=2770637 RepID=A0A8J6U9V1_9FLAO|nr:hypothetical protein [Aestuariibaculum sediminum]MBD0833792.1 hypothetical protein [Aestuariibaculum sediminum]